MGEIDFLFGIGLSQMDAVATVPCFPSFHIAEPHMTLLYVVDSAMVNRTRHARTTAAASTSASRVAFGCVLIFALTLKATWVRQDKR